MSVAPYTYRENILEPMPYNQWYFPSFDQNFGLGIHPMELCPAIESKNFNESQKDFGIVPLLDKDGNFNVSIDVQQFNPNEITVKTVNDMIQVEGKHEEKEDNHGIIMRHFVRKYKIPKDKVDMNQISSSMSSDGILTLKGHKLQGIENQYRVREIPIQNVGPVRNNVVAEKKEINGF